MDYAGIIMPALDGIDELLLLALHPTKAGEVRGVFQLNDEGIHHACFYI
jgi:hypothetical protein